MPANEFLRQLDRNLSPDDVALVTAALRQDSLVWDSLMQPSFATQALNRLGSVPADWNPGRLGLLALADPIDQDALCGEKMIALPQSLQEKALQVYQYTQRTSVLPASLREACLLALALRERRRLTGSWAGLLDEILPRVPSSDTHPFAMWRTALACLYSIVPDPDAMLRALLPKTAAKEANCTRTSDNNAFSLVIHTRLCQPATHEEHMGLFLPLLHGLNVVGQLALLRELSLRGGQALAASLAGSLLIGHPAFANLRAQGTATELDLPGLGSRALALQHLGAFYQLAGDATQAQELFVAAQTALEQWMAGLTLQRISLRAGDGVRMIAAEQAKRMAPALPWLKNDLGAVVISLPCDCEAFDSPENAFLQLKRAAALFEQEPALARDLARQGCVGILAQITQGDLPFAGAFVYDWRPDDLLTILLNLGLLEEARQMADALLALRPNDASLLHLSSRIHEQLGLSRLAIRSARSLAALQPNKPSWRRRLGGLYAQSGLWDAALEQWRAVLNMASTLGVPASAVDRLHCADSAFHAGEMDEAVSLCEGILAEDSNNGAAAGLLGQALVAQGKREQAETWLVRATQLSPETAAPWLALAGLQRELGEPQQALETLRGAVAALPESAEAQLALGEACLTGDMPTEALPHLKQAFLLAPELPPAALLYGRALRTLGHARQARAVLEQVRSVWQNSPELAYEMALVLLDLGEAESALPVLEMALRGSSNCALPVFDASLIYVKILLGEYSGEPVSGESECMVDAGRMQQAELALRRILEMAPDSIEAQFLMADLLRERGDLEQALAIYRELSDQPGASDPNLRWRIQWGMGRTALRLGEYETALVALRDAAQLRADNMPLQRTLAEASLRAGLPSEALQAAIYTLQLAPADVDNLAWFAAFAGGLGESRRAVEALERAVQIEPDQPALRVSLAEWQLSDGDLDAARASLGSLADLEEATANDLRRAAHVYLRLGDSAAALACYEQAITSSADAPRDLLFEAAQLHERQGCLESALELSHRALDESIHSLPVYRFQADLLARMNRPQAAMALLEEALRIAQVDEKAAGTIHESIARLMVQQDNLPTALHHMEKALECSPENAALAYRAADLALSLLQTDRAGRILRAFGAGGLGSATGSLIDQGAEGLELLCMKIEFALAGERGGDAELDLHRWIEQGLALAPGYPRLAAAKARVLAHRGEQADAHRWYEMALAAWKKTGTLGATAPWLAHAALDLHRWKDALTGFERCALTNPTEARAQVQFARALTLAAEYQRTCEVLGFRSAAPGADALGEGSHKKHEACIAAASKQAGSAEIGRWQARGAAAFKPSAQTAKALALLPSTADDSTALAAVLRQINNPTAAVQMARKYIHTPEALLQIALCYIAQPNDEAETIAQSAVDAAPGQPMPFAALAMIRLEYGDFEGALNAYKEALRLSPEEPEWHDAAGDLCIRLGRLNDAIDHRRRAAALEPNSAPYAFRLGQACLAGEDLSEAVSSLEKACTLDPKQSASWLALAGAYQMSGRLPQALEAARTAGALDPTAAEGLLIAGEAALAMEQTELALDYARQAAQREPANAGTVMFLSSTLALLDQPQEALRVIETAPAEVRQSFPVAYERAKLIRRLYGAKQSLEVLEKLVKEFTEEPGLLGLYATVLAESGDTKSAERYAFKSLRIDPDQPELTLMLGCLQRKTGQLDQAVHLFSEAIRMDPDNLDAYLELAGVYQERREVTQALQVYKKAMQVCPDDYRAPYQSGLILRECKDYSGAESMLRKAADLAPDNPSIRRQLVAVIALNLVHQNKQPV